MEDAPSSAIYSDYAAAYDRSGQIRFSILMDMYLQEVLERHPVPGRRMLDLACGTGTLAILQAESGWNVTGMDQSAAMLDEARRKQGATATNITFVEGDMRDFTLSHPVDLVTCFYDSLNYLLTEHDLLRCFAAVRSALVPGGIFCFDLATSYFLREYWRGTETYADDSYRQTMRSSYDDRFQHSTLVLDGVVTRPDGEPHHFREVHVERAYEPPMIERLLRKAGLEPEACYDCFTSNAPNERSLRHFWIARKGSGVDGQGMEDSRLHYSSPDPRPLTPNP